MRIIAGKYRGKKLLSLGDTDIRPTADRVKESVFQILSSRLVGARVLDLFCGSGALGLESLSRGAAEAVFNDKSRESLAVARKNLAAIGEEATLLSLDYSACLARLDGQFDLVFVDPPYREDICGKVLGEIVRQKILKENGLVVYESEHEEKACAGMLRTDLRSYGRTKVSFFAPDKEC